MKNKILDVPDFSSPPFLPFQKGNSPKKFGKYIVEWFALNKRDFPWRDEEVQRDPYAVWISEVMLQQTQAERVVAFFVKFMERFPSVDVLARAEWEEVLEYVRGLGYYRRFRNLIVGSQVVMGEFGGIFPLTYEGLRKIPGVGDYTANAILAFSCGEDVIPMDTNVRQMLKHFFGELEDKELRVIAARACPKGAAREFYQGLMDYAAGELKGLKKAEKSGEKNRKHGKKIISKKISKNISRDGDVPFMKVAAGIIWRGSGRNQEVLIQKRTNKKHLKDLWEFPGGKLEARENERACLKRELFEELGIEAAVRPPFMHTEHDYGDRYVALSWHRCQILLGEPFGKEGQEVKWVRVTELGEYEFPPADEEVIRELL